MNNIDTVAHMNMHYTQYWAHCALFIDAQLCPIAPVAQDRLARVIPSMHVHLCVALWLISLHPSPFPLRSVALLPALPDVFLRVQREVQVQTPVRLPLGDRGHFWPRGHPSQVMSPTRTWTSWTLKSSTSRQPAMSTGSTPSTTTLPSTILMSTITSLRNTLQL